MIGILLGALLGCAAQGPRYPEVVAAAGAPAAGQARIVLLRPNDRFDNYSLSRAVIRIDDRKVGMLAYGGFLLFDVEDGEVVVEASARNRRWYGSCRLRLAAASGEILYLDVGPRPASVAADVVGSMVGAVAAGGVGSSAGPGDVAEVLVVETAEAAIVASAADTAVHAAESAGKRCGGPYRVMKIDASVAQPKLEKLSRSE